MMTIQGALVQLLKADATVSTLAQGLVYPQEAYGNDLPPFVLFACSDPDRELSLNGYLNFYTVSIRFDCYGGYDAPAYGDAATLAKAVEDCLLGFLRGVVTSLVDGSTVQINGVFLTGGDDGLDPPVHGEEKGIDYVGVSFQVMYQF